MICKVVLEETTWMLIFQLAPRRANGLKFTFVDTCKRSLFLSFSFQHDGLPGREGKSVSYKKVVPLIHPT